MAKIIALFNHKGGVSKTTTTFNLGWVLAESGKKVIIVDTDPQCNLTGMTLGFSGMDDFEEFYEKRPNSNIKAALSPAFESRPEPIVPFNCFEVRQDLFLIPSHIGFSEYDVPMGIAHELSGSLQVVKNLPGAINFLLRTTADQYNADYVLIDMSPSISALNQNLFILSDFFIVPCNPDYFCVLAIDSLCELIPRWVNSMKRIKEHSVFKDAVYKLPEGNPKFLGIISQRYRPRYGGPAKSFQKWISQISDKVNTRLVPTLAREGLSMPVEVYSTFVNSSEPYNLVNIADFNSLIAQSQQYNVPIFALTDEQLEQSGNVLINMIESRDNFHRTFMQLAGKIITLTNQQ